MFPVLVEIPLGWLPWVADDFSFPIRMFGVMVILGFLAGTWVVSKRLKERGIMESQDSFDFCFYLLAVGILGSRILYVMQNWGQFAGKGQPWRIFYIWEGGLVWYGGMAASVVFAFWWLWKKKLPVLPCADAAAMGVAIAHAIGRIGCFFAGDDYGRHVLAEDGKVLQSPAPGPWYAVQFPKHTAGPRYAYSETPAAFCDPYWVHPVQLYMAFGNLVVFVCLLLIGRRAKRPGVVAASYLLIYPVNRFVVEFWRGDADRLDDVWHTGLSFSQMFGIPMVLLGFFVLRVALTRTPEDPRTPAS
jgi:phosphatidylglycerol:prolipoprotein diacylglycerol transferase